MCPDCRFVFRVPQDHDGNGIACPSCRRMLRVPSAQDNPPPLMARLRQAAPGQPVAATVQPMLRKRRHRRKAVDDHSWEHQASSAHPRRGEKRQMNLILMGGATLFVLILGWVFFSMNTGPQVVVNSEVSVAPAAAAAVVVVPSPVQTARGDKEFLAEAEPLASEFLNASTVDEIIPLVRDPAAAEARIRGFYPEGKIEAVGLSSFNTGGEVLNRGKSSGVMIRTRDHVERALAFVETPDGLKIDWESWVGWSEMPWENFLSSQPAAPLLFRVNLSAVEYYNFEFGDESKWQSFRLESPDREHAIYGYAPKGSVLAAKLRPVDGSMRSALMVTLKFPESSSSRTQVEIESLAGEGWVEGADAP